MEIFRVYEKTMSGNKCRWHEILVGSYEWRSMNEREGFRWKEQWAKSVEEWAHSWNTSENANCWIRTTTSYVCWCFQIIRRMRGIHNARHSLLTRRRSGFLRDPKRFIETGPWKCTNLFEPLRTVQEFIFFYIYLCRQLISFSSFFHFIWMQIEDYINSLCLVVSIWNWMNFITDISWLRYLFRIKK